MPENLSNIMGTCTFRSGSRYLDASKCDHSRISWVFRISEIIAPCLSSNSTLSRTLAARVLSSAVQNNAEVQIAALKAGVITPLLKNIALEKGYEIRSSSLSALSCLIRGFPLAEIKLIEEGGLSVLLSLFDEDSVNALKLQVFNFQLITIQISYFVHQIYTRSYTYYSCFSVNH